MIHQVWIGKPLPAIQALQATWQGLPYKLWGEEELRELIPESVFNRHPAFVADIARIFILAKEGGIYVDSDFEMVKSPLGLLNNFFVGRPTLNPDHYSNALIGCPKDHPIISELLIAIHESNYDGQFGPNFLSAKLKGRTDFVGYDRKYFYPYYAGQSIPESYPPQTYAVHHWFASWVKDPKYQKKFHENMSKKNCSPRPAG